MVSGVKPCALGLLRKPLWRIIFSIKHRGIGAEKNSFSYWLLLFPCIFPVCTRLLWLLSYFPSHHKRLVLHNSKNLGTVLPMAFVYGIYYLTKESAKRDRARARTNLNIISSPRDARTQRINFKKICAQTLVIVCVYEFRYHYLLEREARYNRINDARRA